MKLSPVLILFYVSLLVILGYWLSMNVKCTLDTFAAGPSEVCIGDTCLNENDAKALKALPQRVETRSVKMGTWNLQPESNDAAFVIRDNSVAGRDKRYAFFRGESANF